MIPMRPLLISAALLGGCRTLVEPPMVEPSTRDQSATSVSRNYDELLGRIVQEDGTVNYNVLSANREALDVFVAALAEPSREGAAAPTAAFWINAYNALVLYSVLETDRPSSVLDVDGWIPVDGAGFFFERAFRVRGEQLSLWDIEHERLRGVKMDHRIHAALNCASRSCPPLRAGLYSPGTLNSQLDEQMRMWLRDPTRGLKMVKGTPYFSDIFRMFSRDFYHFSSGQDLCKITAKYAKREHRKRLLDLSAQGCPHGYLSYDWRLNDSSLRPAIPEVELRPDGR